MNALAQQTVGRIVAENLHTAKIFESYNIDFCCQGNIELAEACRSKGLDLEEVIRQINAAGRSQTRGQPDFFRLHLYDLTKYIVDVHHSYMYHLVPEIESHLQVASGTHAKSHPELKEALHTFAEFKDVFFRHMRMEEEEFFPYINALAQANVGTAPMPPPMKMGLSEYIRFLEEDHRTASGLITKIKSICNNYVIPSDACITYRLFITQLQELEADTHVHINLEESVLHPRARELEQELKS
ncbi:DUF542 domain-containing protein [Lentisphaerota bacterium ZTH]|nr:DUF542 domain-containing protein [Lentisphaerota bacterium]WET06875.1 DUF542 domain-containing protein [Lentisphaerota bacterium ZTH]